MKSFSYILTYIHKLIEDSQRKLSVSAHSCCSHSLGILALEVQPTCNTKLIVTLCTFYHNQCVCETIYLLLQFMKREPRSKEVSFCLQIENLREILEKMCNLLIPPRAIPETASSKAGITWNTKAMRERNYSIHSATESNQQLEED